MVRCHFIERFQSEANLFLETQTEEVGGALRDEVGRLGYQIRNVSCFNGSRSKKREPVHTSLSRQSVRVFQTLAVGCCSRSVAASQDLMDRQLIVRLYYLGKSITRFSLTNLVTDGLFEIFGWNCGPTQSDVCAFRSEDGNEASNTFTSTTAGWSPASGT